MADIFISYSSQDREKAEMLTELLISAGLSVWIDHSALEVSTSWSAEIVDAISSCTAFIVLLSPNSVESHNVIKEVSLASEKRKKILPLDLEPIAIPRELEYQLAGIQRTPMTNIDSIIRALGKLGLEATQAPSIKLIKENDSRKSLMVLPFDDLSPTADNSWFADGIVSELISALANVKSLRLMDQQETRSFKSYTGHLTEYARIMQVRYFLQGSVRKFGDQIKITAQLLDIDSGDYLWQHSLKGVMENIFDIQEEVAQKVVEGLKIHLDTDEKKKLTERGTQNTDAYELFLKGDEYYYRMTKEGYQLAIQLFSEAITLDPDYANAYSSKAHALANLYRVYDRDPALLQEALTLAKEALRLQPDLFSAYSSLSQAYMYQGMNTEAEATVKEYIRKAPDDWLSHFSLGLFYNNISEYSKAIAAFEEAVRLKPNDRITLYYLAVACDDAAYYASNELMPEKRRNSAEMSLKIYERHLKLHPDDENSRQQYADLLLWSGRRDDARLIAYGLKNATDAKTLYNTASMLVDLDDPQEALLTFRKAIEAGFKHIRLLQEFLTDNGITSLIGTPEYEEAKNLVEEIVEGVKAKEQE